MSGSAKTSMDIEEQMQRMLKMEQDMDQTDQAMTYATIQIWLNIIATVLAVVAGTIALVKAFPVH